MLLNLRVLTPKGPLSLPSSIAFSGYFTLLTFGVSITPLSSVVHMYRGFTLWLNKEAACSCFLTGTVIPPDFSNDASYSAKFMLSVNHCLFSVCLF